jgi:hypothetical protein
MEITEIRLPARKLGTKANFEHDKAIAKKAPKGVVPKIRGAYVREKKIGKYHYRYLVKSYRIDHKIRQKALRYLGIQKECLLGCINQSKHSTLTIEY